MSVTIAASAMRTCLGDGPETFAALLRGDCGAAPLRRVRHARAGVGHGYEIDDDRPFAASGWLAGCVADALVDARVDPAHGRVLALVGTGLRELAAVERHALGELTDLATERLHFGPAVTAVAPGIGPVLTLSNACSAGGHALALAQDLIELGEADAVVVGGTDTMTTSMLTMIGRVADETARRIRPFDAERVGVLLGDGAAAVVLVPGAPGPRQARLLATGLSCDASHETAPDVDGILRAMTDAHDRADRRPEQVDLVVAHGTGTALNDPAEARALHTLFSGCAPGPLVTAVKGAVGHTSGGSALVSVAVAIECLRDGRVPAICGLREPLACSGGLRLVRGDAVCARPRVAQIDAFGFGGLNAVTLIEAA